LRVELLPRPTQTMPGFIKPQLATPKSRAPKGDQWLHEIKFDGYRIQVHVNGGRKKVYTRNGLDWTNRFSVIAGALDFSGQAIIDGEVASMKGAPTSRNCRLNLPPVDRIDLSTSPSISFGVMETSGSSHRSSASRHCWTCSVETASGLPWFTVNISSATGRRCFGIPPSLGKQEGKELVYMGKVGTGWSRTVSSEIRKQLDAVVSPKSKLTKPIKKPKATWVEPKFFADVENRDITSEGLLRARSFKGPSRK
jgi:bifunctional non-homologous end joining protein LigD